MARFMISKNPDGLQLVAIEQLLFKQLKLPRSFTDIDRLSIHTRASFLTSLPKRSNLPKTGKSICLFFKPSQPLPP